MLTINRGAGFQIDLSNGYTVSVQFGPGHYCDRRDFFKVTAEPTERYSSETAEVAVIRPDGSFIQLSEHETVLGWVSADNVARIIAIATYNPEGLTNYVKEPV